MQVNNPAIITNRLSHGSKCFTMQLKQPRSTARAEHCSLAEGSSSEGVPARHRHINFENTLLTPPPHPQRLEEYGLGHICEHHVPNRTCDYQQTHP